MTRKPYRHLSHEQRSQIYALKKRGISHRAIAKELGVHPRTIDREVKRNTGGCGYRYEQAHQKCLTRRHQRKGIPTKLTPRLRRLVIEKLTRYQWSPEQISGWLQRHTDYSLSHESIYQLVWQNKGEGGRLYSHLRHRAKCYQRRLHGKSKRGQIIGRVDIAERPAIVELKERVGDWEADTVVGKGRKSALVTLVERKSRYTLVVKVKRANAFTVSQAIVKALRGLPVHTITFDNGKEFAAHQWIAVQLKCKTYFATPYHSWERGLNEHTNGLIRQYFPKKTDFRHVHHSQVKRVERLLNNRPRKCLGYATPLEVIHSAA